MIVSSKYIDGRRKSNIYMIVNGDWKLAEEDDVCECPACKIWISSNNSVDQDSIVNNEGSEHTAEEEEADASMED